MGFVALTQLGDYSMHLPPLFQSNPWCVNFQCHHSSHARSLIAANSSLSIVLVPLQALLTCVGNSTAAIAAYRIARSNGWQPDTDIDRIQNTFIPFLDGVTRSPTGEFQETATESDSLVGFEDLGAALAGDNDYTFLIKLFGGCAAASYVIKYGELYFDFPYDANVFLGLAFIGVPSALNAFKWYKRSQDPTFEGWF